MRNRRKEVVFMRSQDRRKVKPWIALGAVALLAFV
jgi:hypothetical protein